MACEDHEGGAGEPAAVKLELVSGIHPTYAAIRRRDSRLQVVKVELVTNLDRRPSDRPDRQMMTLNCTWMNKPIKISCCHCPSSKKREWNPGTKAAVLPNVFELAGLLPFDDWRGGAAEPVAWILGGDLNVSENLIANQMLKCQPHGGGERLVQTVDAGSLVKRHGDLAMAQHVRVFQRDSLIGLDYGGISDNHNMVIVEAKEVC